MIESEADVRKWVTEVFPPPAVLMRLEAAAGATFGLPDMIVETPDETVRMELKKGVLKGSELKFKVRPAQRRFAREMAAVGKVVLGVIGIIGTERIAVGRMVEISDGKADLSLFDVVCVHECEQARERLFQKNRFQKGSKFHFFPTFLPLDRN